MLNSTETVEYALLLSVAVCVFLKTEINRKKSSNVRVDVDKNFKEFMVCYFLRLAERECCGNHLKVSATFLSRLLHGHLIPHIGILNCVYKFCVRDSYLLEKDFCNMLGITSSNENRSISTAGKDLKCCIFFKLILFC